MSISILRGKGGEQSLLAPHELNSSLSSVFGATTMSLTHLSMEASPKGSLLLFDLPTELVCGTLQALFVLSLSNLILSLA